MEHRSLPTLAAHAFLGTSDAFYRAAQAAGGWASFLVWADFFRIIPDEGISLRELPRASRVSRRAARLWLGFEQWGLLTVVSDRPRSKRVVLTERGREVRDACGALATQADAEWSASCGSHLAPLRASLERIVNELELEFPHHPMVYGAADWSALGGSAKKEKAGPPRVPPHGTEYAPVLRSQDGTASDLPIYALLSQTLMAFTADYEERHWESMALAAILSQAHRTGVAPSRAWLERLEAIKPTRDPEAPVELTPGGHRMRSHFESTVSEVTELWRGRHGTGPVDSLCDALTKLDDSAGTATRPDGVLVGFIGGAGFVCISAEQS